jgi:hypothetical protein
MASNPIKEIKYIAYIQMKSFVWPPGWFVDRKVFEDVQDIFWTLSATIKGYDDALIHIEYDDIAKAQKSHCTCASFDHNLPMDRYYDFTKNRFKYQISITLYFNTALKYFGIKYGFIIRDESKILFIKNWDEGFIYCPSEKTVTVCDLRPLVTGLYDVLRDGRLIMASMG